VVLGRLGGPGQNGNACGEGTAGWGGGLKKLKEEEGDALGQGGGEWEGFWGLTHLTMFEIHMGKRKRGR